MALKTLCFHCEQLKNISSFENQSVLNWRLREIFTWKEMVTYRIGHWLCKTCQDHEGPLPDPYGERGTCDCCNEQDVPRREIEDPDDSTCLSFVCFGCWEERQ